MGKFSRLARWAIITGPAVVQMVQRYGPVLKKFAKDNPDTVDQLSSKLKNYQKAKRKTGIEGAATRIAVLKQQVSFLYASANTAAVAQQATEWKAELTKLEVSLPLIDVMSTAEKRRKLKEITAKIDQLASEVLAAVVEDEVEDAIIIDNENEVE